MTTKRIPASMVLSRDERSEVLRKALIRSKVTINDTSNQSNFYVSDSYIAMKKVIRFAFNSMLTTKQ